MAQRVCKYSSRAEKEEMAFQFRHTTNNKRCSLWKINDFVRRIYEIGAIFKSCLFILYPQMKLIVSRRRTKWMNNCRESGDKIILKYHFRIRLFSKCKWTHSISSWRDKSALYVNQCVLKDDRQLSSKSFFFFYICTLMCAYKCLACKRTN